jgi:hypothetical protein
MYSRLGSGDVLPTRTTWRTARVMAVWMRSRGFGRYVHDAQSRFGGRFARRAPIAQCRIDSRFRIRLNRRFPVHHSLSSIRPFSIGSAGGQ